MVFNLRYADTPGRIRRYLGGRDAKTSYINQNETQEPLEP
jgi:hypothetical protein